MSITLLSFLGCGLGTGNKVSNRQNGKSWYAKDVFADDNARALAIAASKGDVQKIQNLYEKGADVNYRGEGGITPLLWSLYANNKIGFEKLLQLGADPSVKTDKGSGAMDIMSYAEGNYTTLDYMQLSLEHGGNPDILFDNSTTLLTLACLRPKPDLMKMLVKAGADPNKKNGYSWTPIMLCAMESKYQYVLYLIEHGAIYDNSIKDSMGHTFANHVAETPVSAVERPEEKKARDKVIKMLNKKGIALEKYAHNRKK